jgi:hypothetical protein
LQPEPSQRWKASCGPAAGRLSAQAEIAGRRGDRTGDVRGDDEASSAAVTPRDTAGII